MDQTAADRLLRDMFAAAVRVADPMTCVPPALPPRPPVGAKGRVVVVGAGKASARMAQAVEAAWPASPEQPLEGLVITRYGHAAPCQHIEIVEAAHPVPDAAGEAATARILDLVQGLGPEDLCLVLMSGGGSSLLSLPAPGLTLADKQAVNTALLASGAAIDEMNCLRKHLSRVKGGRLALAAAPAQVVTLAISDVPGDDPSVIASGPTVGDVTTLAQARAILDTYGIAVPAAVEAALMDPANETPAPDDPGLAKARLHMVAAPQQSLDAAADVARAAGVTPMILGDALEGEARDVGTVLAGVAHQVRRHGQPVAPPCVLISGGETTVTLRPRAPDQPRGRGGRNVECLLGMLRTLDGAPGIHAIAGDTDGVDGAEEVAGAVIHPDTRARAAAKGQDLDAALARNDAHGYFAVTGDQVITGPTLTNVNDFRAILIM